MIISSINSLISEINNDLGSNLKIRLEDTFFPDGLIIHLTGQIDTYNSSKLQAVIATIIATGVIYVIFDFSSISYMSSTGIGSLTFILKSLTPKKGKMVIYGIQPKTYDILNLLGFTMFFDIRSTKEESLQFIESIPNAVKELFPLIFDCPVCRSRLKAPRAGKFKCSRCKGLIIVNSKGLAKYY